MSVRELTGESVTMHEIRNESLSEALEEAASFVKTKEDDESLSLLGFSMTAGQIPDPDSPLGVYYEIHIFVRTL